MNRWLQNSINNMLPLSESDTFAEATKEWRTNGQIIEADEGESFVCELCEKEELSTHFGISNTINDNAMYVGSKCILKFSEIIVVDPDTGRPVTGDDRRRVLNRQLDRLKRKKEKERKAEAEKERLNALLSEQRLRLKERAAQEKADRDAFLFRLRELYRRATKSQSFIAEVGKAIKQGSRLTPAQQKGISRLLDAFRL